MKDRGTSSLDQRPGADDRGAGLSFFNVVMAASYFRQAAQARHPEVVRGMGREYLAKAGHLVPTRGS